MLTIKRPTSTTVLYTVSSRPATPTIAMRARHSLLFVLRILAGLFVTTLLLHEYRSIAAKASPVLRFRIETLLLNSLFGRAVSVIGVHSTRIWRLLISSGIVWLIFRKSYTTESLLVIRGLGVQTSTSSPSYLWTSSTRFIPTSSIQDILIHEAFKGFEVRFYLNIVVEGEEGVVVVFPVSRS